MRPARELLTTFDEPPLIKARVLWAGVGLSDVFTQQPRKLLSQIDVESGCMGQHKSREASGFLDEEGVGEHLVFVPHHAIFAHLKAEAARGLNGLEDIKLGQEMHL